ncbi:MAG: hypothetical protein ABIR96_01760 [Bdellovibrionota bacterium]
MGNALVLILIATFGVVWGRFAHIGAWAAFRKLFKAPTSELKTAWYWGVGSITTGLLFGFALLAMALPPLLVHVFAKSEEVSVSLIALGIIVMLSLAWLVSLNRYRVIVENFYPDQEI